MSEIHKREDRPVVFLSYAWTSETHRRWVHQLADDLVANGIDVLFDGYSLRPGHDTFAYMEQIVTRADVSKVLCICDELYQTKADGREGGVGTETQIITPELYAKTEQTKFVALVRERDPTGKPRLPAFLAGRFFIDFSDDDQYHERFDELLRDIYSKPRRPKPPFGPAPAFLTEDVDTLATAGQVRRIEQALQGGLSSARGLIERYGDSLLTAVGTYRLSAAESQHQDMDDRIWNSIHKLRAYRDDCLRVVDAIALYASDKSEVRSLARLLDGLLGLEVSVNEYRTEAAFDNIRFFRRDLFHCAIALLLRRGRFGEVEQLLSYGYYLQSNGTGKACTFAAFHQYLFSLDEVRNHRLKLGRTSVTADLIRELVPTAYFDFRSAMQADFILYVRSMLDLAESADSIWISTSSIWVPVTAPYFEFNADFELFRRANSKSGLSDLMTVFGTQSKREFLERFEAGGAKMRDWFGRHGKSDLVAGLTQGWPA